VGLFKKKQLPTAAAAAPEPSRDRLPEPESQADRGLRDPGLDADDPRQMYHHNLVNGESISWFTTKAESTVLADYVFSLLGLTPVDVDHAQQGFAQTRDASMLLTLVEGPRGSAFTVWGFNPSGTGQINEALNREWEKTREELGRGEYRGNPASAKHAAIVEGQLHHEFEGSDLLTVINNAHRVVRLDG
jgi:hypothetical protein